jgi:hypothetical protein
MVCSQARKMIGLASVGGASGLLMAIGARRTSTSSRSVCVAVGAAIGLLYGLRARPLLL